MPRPGKPIGLHLLEGNPNRLTKAAIAARQDTEVHIGNQVLIESDNIRRNKIAHRQWLEIMEVRKTAEADWITSADIPLLEMICMTADELNYLETAKRDLKKQAKKEKWGSLKTINAMNQLQLDNNINKKKDLYLKLLERIYWTPLSRYKNVGKKQKPAEETPLQKAGFGFV